MPDLTAGDDRRAGRPLGFGGATGPEGDGRENDRDRATQLTPESDVLAVETQDAEPFPQEFPEGAYGMPEEFTPWARRLPRRPAPAPERGR